VVSGTSDGSIFVVSNTNINSSQGAAGIVVNGGEKVTSVMPSELAHTFTIPDLNLNIPIPVSSTVVAFFTVDKAGTFFWFCESACGLPAMSTPGWMRGSLVAS
jgi:heme/copper-type cytochrome/quinol oxidase subunit 2